MFLRTSLILGVAATFGYHICKNREGDSANDAKDGNVGEEQKSYMVKRHAYHGNDFELIVRQPEFCFFESVIHNKTFRNEMLPLYHKMSKNAIPNKKDTRGCPFIIYLVCFGNVNTEAPTVVKHNGSATGGKGNIERDVVIFRIQRLFNNNIRCAVVKACELVLCG